MSNNATYQCSYFYSWEYGLLLFLGAAFFVLPSAFTDAWLVYAPMQTSPETIDRIFRWTGLALLLTAGGFILKSRWGSRYLLLGDGVESRSGLFGGKVKVLRFRHMHGIVISKTLMGMLLGYGTVRFTSDRSATDDVVFVGIEEPEALREVVRKIIYGEENQAADETTSPATADPQQPVVAPAPAPAPAPAQVSHSAMAATGSERTEPVISEPERNAGPARILLSEATDEEIYTELARRAEQNSQRINFDADEAR